MERRGMRGIGMSELLCLGRDGVWGGEREFFDLRPCAFLWQYTSTEIELIYTHVHVLICTPELDQVCALLYIAMTGLAWEYLEPVAISMNMLILILPSLHPSPFTSLPFLVTTFSPQTYLSLLHIHTHTYRQ